MNLFEIVRVANQAGIYGKVFASVEDLMKFDKTV